MLRRHTNYLCLIRRKKAPSKSGFSGLLLPLILHSTSNVALISCQVVSGEAARFDPCPCPCLLFIQFRFPFLIAIKRRVGTVTAVTTYLVDTGGRYGY